jgi:hypothetical protein
VDTYGSIKFENNYYIDRRMVISWVQVTWGVHFTSKTNKNKWWITNCEMS